MKSREKKRNASEIAMMNGMVQKHGKRRKRKKRNINIASRERSMSELQAFMCIIHNCDAVMAMYNDEYAISCSALCLIQYFE